MTSARHRPEGTATRGTTAPNRLRRVDRWITANQARLLHSSESPPLVVDLGFGASPVTTIEFYERLLKVRPDVEVGGLEIDPARVEQGRRFLAEYSRTASHCRLAFELGGFELPVSRPPLLVRAFNVLRQYGEEEAWRAWNRLCGGLAHNGVLIEGTCDETGRRAVWVTLGRSDGTASSLREKKTRQGDQSGPAEPRTITFSRRVSTLPCPSELAERLPKTLINHNVPGDTYIASLLISIIPGRLRSAVGVWTTAALDRRGRTPFVDMAGNRAAARWGPLPWRLGEATLPWNAICPR